MTMKIKYVTMMLRALILVLFIAGMAMLGELVFVYGMRLFGHPVYFTSFFAVGFFSCFVGFLPTLPSPSRISSMPIGVGGRVVLLIEITLAVALAIFASSKFMAYEHVVVPIDLAFAAYAYGLILVATLIANFGRLRREISASD